MNTSKANPEHQSALEMWRSGKETRTIVTPFAFSVAEELYGLPLGRPWKRAAAMVSDLFLLALLSTTPYIFLPFVMAIAAWKLLKRYDNFLHRWVKGLFRGISLVTILVIGLDLSQSLLDAAGWGESSTQSARIRQAAAWVESLPELVYLENCDNMSCVESRQEDFREALNKLSASNPEAAPLIVSELLEGLEWMTPEERQIMKESLLADLPPPADEEEKNSADKKSSGKSKGKIIIRLEDESPSGENHSPSLIAWTKGIIADLGLGLSWSALYFTLFITLWSGKTPGKRLFGLQVVQLDNKAISLWGAFGRYGGYGAGVATGLLGFLQIYWDPNRQAIQDKIAGTVVISTWHKGGNSISSHTVEFSDRQ